MNREFESRQNNTLRNAVIVGGLLTAALHGYIEVATDSGHGPRVEASDFNPFLDETVKTVNGGTVPVGEPYVDTVSGTERISGPSTDEHRRELNLTGGAYARHFDEDPMAGVLEQQSIDDFVETVNSYKADGWDVTIHVHGLASAEDATLDGFAGVQTPSDDNQRLANTRRDAFVDALTEYGIQESTIVLENGVEGQLTDSQVETLHAYTQQFGYESVDVLIQAYNDDPESVPPVVNGVLNSWLDESRGVSAVMIAERAVPGTSHDQPTEKEVCIVPVMQVINKDATKESWKVTVPYGVALGLGAMGISIVAMTASGVGMMARDIRKYREVKGVSGAGGSGSGSGSSPEDQAPIDAYPHDEIPTKPEPKDKEKRGCIGKYWKEILIAPVLLAGSALAIHSCMDNDPAPKREVEQPTDPCVGLDRQEKVVSVKTIETRNGRNAIVTVKPAN
ncbi:hypothetical protein KC968_01485 [Candidatus Saccharibacteria bacterium]|nr:hypothetical protein [Candidatus Saccharibacteria bacterium]